MPDSLLLPSRACPFFPLTSPDASFPNLLHQRRPASALLPLQPAGRSPPPLASLSPSPSSPRLLLLPLLFYLPQDGHLPLKLVPAPPHRHRCRPLSSRPPPTPARLLRPRASTKLLVHLGSVPSSRGRPPLLPCAPRCTSVSCPSGHPRTRAPLRLLHLPLSLSHQPPPPPSSATSLLQLPCSRCLPALLAAATASRPPSSPRVAPSPLPGALLLPVTVLLAPYPQQLLARQVLDAMPARGPGSLSPFPFPSSSHFRRIPSGSCLRCSSPLPSLDR